jgi:cytochrome c553
VAPPTGRKPTTTFMSTRAIKSSSRFGRTLRRLVPVILCTALSVSRAQETVPMWAFPLTSASRTPAPPQESHTLPGSTRKFTRAQLLDRTVAVDWYPAEHPAMPSAVRGGNGRRAACGFCHLPEGQGRPENASLAGLPYTYLLQQISDMKSGARKLVNPHFTPGALMLQAVSQIGEADAEQVARYFSALRYTKRVRVIESAAVPSFTAQGFVYVFDSSAPSQPLGERIIEGPDDFSRFEERDNRVGYSAYVPVGSIARGATLAKGDGKARQPCVTCHGPGLRGGPIGPPIAGRSPTALFRQLYAFQLGTRNGTNAAQMKLMVTGLAYPDMLALAAYVGSLASDAH